MIPAHEGNEKERHDPPCHCTFVTIWPGHPSPRPNFATIDDYIEHLRIGMVHGHEPWPPASLEEYIALSHEWPAMARQYWPPPRWARMLGLPTRPPEVASPLPARLRERLVATLAADPQLCAAVWSLVRGATG